MYARGVEGDLCIATERIYAEHAQRVLGVLHVARWTQDGHRHEATVWLRYMILRGWWVRETAGSGNRAAPRWVTARLETWARSVEVSARSRPVWMPHSALSARVPRSTAF